MQTTWLFAGGVVEDTLRTDGQHGIVWMWGENVSPSGAITAMTGLSQARFAELLGISVRTLQEWEQGRREPSGAARTLLLIAHRNPGALLEVA